MATLSFPSLAVTDPIVITRCFRIGFFILYRKVQASLFSAVGTATWRQQGLRFALSYMSISKKQEMPSADGPIWQQHV